MRRTKLSRIGFLLACDQAKNPKERTTEHQMAAMAMGRNMFAKVRYLTTSGEQPSVEMATIEKVAKYLGCSTYDLFVFHTSGTRILGFPEAPRG